MDGARGFIAQAPQIDELAGESGTVFLNDASGLRSISYYARSGFRLSDFNRSSME
jgi:hypothetical protein